MKKTGHITFGAVLAALSVVTMLMSYFPYLTYSIPALAGMFIMVAVIELGNKWALFSYIVSAFLSLIFAEPEAALFYAFLFGCYPIIKALIEKIKFILLRYAVKLLYFNVVVAIIYVFLLKLLGLPTGFEGIGTYMIVGVLIVVNIVFLIYDFAVLRVSQWYIWRLHPRINKLIKK